MLTQGEVISAHDSGQSCKCVSRHSPRYDELHAHHVLPLSEGGSHDGELLWLCPTMHVNVHELWRMYKRYEGKPPWHVRRQYSLYCRRVVDRGWALAHG